MNTKNRKNSKRTSSSLLPWHAAGTLSRRDAARVEQALANDNELARRYELVREELGETIHLNETLGAPSARAMEKLFAKIDAEPARTAEGVVQPRRLAHRFRHRLLAAHAGLWRDRGRARDRVAGRHPRRPGRQGAARSDRSLPPTSRAARSASGSYVLIRFKPQASAADITKFLSDNKATVVGGPAAGTGLFRLRVADRALSQGELGRSSRQWRRPMVVTSRCRRRSRKRAPQKRNGILF